MNRSPLSALPVAASFNGGPHRVSRLGSTLPSTTGIETKKWFPPLVVIPSVPVQAVESISKSKPSATVAFLPIPFCSAAAGEPKLENYREIVFSPKRFSTIPQLAITASDRVDPVEETGSEELKMLPDIIIPSERELERASDGFEMAPVIPALEKTLVAPVAEVEPESHSDFTADYPFQAAPYVPQPEFTDKDLTEAFTPLIESVARRVVVTGDRDKLDALLEPMLRATIRRALAEYSPSKRPFEAPGFLDKTVWRMQALFSSRTYEDVLFEKTHRFQVEEVYLLDAETLALVSFASCDPARHSTVKRVDGSAKRIALQIREEGGDIRRSFEQVDGRNVIAERGEYLIMVAIVRGQANEMMLADLEFSLKRIEEHFRERFQEAGSALMHALQPFLEDCLLIQSPASAA